MVTKVIPGGQESVNSAGSKTWLRIQSMSLSAMVRGQKMMVAWLSVSGTYVWKSICLLRTMITKLRNDIALICL